MPQNIRIALFLMGELVAALHANDPDTFKCWRSGGVQDLGKPMVEELTVPGLALPASHEEENVSLLGRAHGVNR